MATPRAHTPRSAPVCVGGFVASQGRGGIGGGADGGGGGTGDGRGGDEGGGAGGGKGSGKGSSAGSGEGSGKYGGKGGNGGSSKGGGRVGGEGGGEGSGEGGSRSGGSGGCEGGTVSSAKGGGTGGSEGGGEGSGDGRSGSGVVGGLRGGRGGGHSHSASHSSACRYSVYSRSRTGHVVCGWASVEVAAVATATRGGGRWQVRAGRARLFGESGISSVVVAGGQGGGDDGNSGHAAPSCSDASSVSRMHVLRGGLSRRRRVPSRSMLSRPGGEDGGLVGGCPAPAGTWIQRIAAFGATAAPCSLWLR